MRKYYYQILMIISVMMVCKQSGKAFQDCPDPEAFYNTIKAAHDLDKLAETTNPTEIELKAVLKKVMDGSVTSSILVNAWSKIDNFYNGYSNGPIEMINAANRLGDVNRVSGCIAKYNTWIGKEGSEQVAKNTEETKAEDKGDTGLGLDNRKRGTRAVDDDPNKGFPGLTVINGQINTLSKKIEENQGLINDVKNNLPAMSHPILKWLVPGLVGLVLLVLGYLFIYLQPNFVRIRTRLRGIDSYSNDSDLVMSLKREFQSLKDQLNDLKASKNMEAEPKTVTVPDTGKLTLIFDELSQIKTRLNKLNESMVQKTTVAPKASPVLPEQPPKPQVPAGPKVVEEFYYSAPHEGHFQGTLHIEHQDVVYRLEVLEGKQQALYSVVQRPINMQRAIKDQNDVLAPACLYFQRKRPESHHRAVVTTEKGKAIPDGNGGWRIEQKATIQFTG